jgi:hypothetical protein
MRKAGRGCTRQIQTEDTNIGYTHYWEPTAAALTTTAFGRLSTAASKVAELSDVAICYEYDEPDKAPVFKKEGIRLNGRGEDGHETFLLSLGASGFDFCKTAAKPYDVVVTAILVLADHFSEGRFNVSSDGTPEDWAEGLALARKVVPEVKLPVGLYPTEHLREFFAENR